MIADEVFAAASVKYFIKFNTHNRLSHAGPGGQITRNALVRLFYFNRYVESKICKIY